MPFDIETNSEPGIQRESETGKKRNRIIDSNVPTRKGWETLAKTMERISRETADKIEEVTSS
jgi:hypothetical protein